MRATRFAQDADVEILSATAALAAPTAIDLTGNEIANSIFGNAGANILDGKERRRLSRRRRRRRQLRLHHRVGAGNVDTLADFLSGTDKIQLDDAVFAGLALGALAAARS